VVIRTFHVDIRYKGQNYEITVPINQMVDEVKMIDQMIEDFESRHKILYGYVNDGSAIELVNYRLQAIGPVEKITITADKGREPAEPVSTRNVYLAEYNERRDVPLYDRFSLAVGQQLAGPVIV